MKKSIGLLFGLFLGVVLARSSHAAAYAVSPKDTFVTPYSTTISTWIAGPGAVYEVTLATGASGEYIVLYDTSSTSGITIGTASGGGSTNVVGLAGFIPPGPALSGRIYFSSTTQNTQIKYDPPLQFFNGLAVGDSANTGSATITYEVGRGLSGD